MKRKQNQVQSFPFELPWTDGRTYSCVRHVSGTRTLTQTVEVLGVGSLEDGQAYGRPPGRFDPAAMQGRAFYVAGELLRKSQR